MIVQRIAGGISEVVYREIDVRSHPDVNFDGPTICVSNHFGGLSDAVLIVDNLPVMPRIVARDVIWKIPVVGRLMRAMKAIPVHRRADGPGGSNEGMFDDCFAALAAQDTILIFPEGVTQEDPHIAEVKTGAARIALGALETGVAEVAIVPIGLHYADKAGFRNSALVNIGAPIKVAAWLAANPEPESDPVRALTELISQAMRHVAQDYPDWGTCRDFELAAEVMLHDVDAGSLPIRYGDRTLIADHLYEQATAPRDRRTAAPAPPAPPARTATGHVPPVTHPNPPESQQSRSQPTTVADAAAANRPAAGVRPGQPVPPDSPVVDLLAAVADYRSHTRALRAGDLAIRRVGATGAPRSERSWIASLILILLLSVYALVGLTMVFLPWLLVKLTRLFHLAPAVQASVTPGLAALVFGAQWGSILWRGWVNNGADGVALGLILPPFFVACSIFVVERIVLLVRRIGVRRLRPNQKVQAAVASRQAVSDRAWRLA